MSTDSSEKKGLQLYMEKLHKELHKDNPVTQYLAQAEAKTGVNRVHIVLAGGVLLTLIVALCFGGEFLMALISFVYPAYKSIKAIETDDKDDDTQWLMYWVVYSYVTFCEFFIDMILWWFPFYFTTKFLLFLWCMAPIKQNGSVVLYQNIVKPFFDKYEKEIDNYGDQLQSGVQQFSSEMSKAASDAKDNLDNNLRQRVQQGVEDSLSSALSS